MRKNLVYFSVISSLFGANFISINLGFFQLSIFRALIMFITMIIFIELLVCKSIIFKRNINGSKYSIRFMFIWVVYAFFTLAWVKDYSLWIKAIYFLTLGFLCIIIFNRYFKYKTDILRAFRLISIMVIVHNLIGWYEITTGHYLFLSIERASVFILDNSPVSIFGNTNDFATFMLFSVFITYICANSTRNIILKLIYIVTIISSVSLLIMSGSRANILGLLLASAFFIYYSIRNNRSKRSLLIILLFSFSFILIFPKNVGNLFLLFDEKLYFRFLEQVGSDSTRLNLIKNGLTFLLATFGFGTGAGNIEYWMNNYGLYNTSGVLNIHNWWMEILVGYGLIIFIMYTIFYIKLFNSAYNKFRKSDDKLDVSISLGIMCCMIGYTIGSVSSSSNISSEWLWVFWAIAIAYQSINIEENRINKI